MTAVSNSYRDQVKPFGFLLALRAKQEWRSNEEVVAHPRRGRPPKIESPKPVALFERDLAKVAATAFDRESGQLVPADAMQTYREAVAQSCLATLCQMMRPCGASLANSLRQWRKWKCCAQSGGRSCRTYAYWFKSLDLGVQLESLG